MLLDGYIIQNMSDFKLGCAFVVIYGVAMFLTIWIPERIKKKSTK